MAFECLLCFTAALQNPQSSWNFLRKGGLLGPGGAGRTIEATPKLDRG